LISFAREAASETLPTSRSFSPFPKVAMCKIFASSVASVGRISRRRNPPFQVNKSAGYASLTRPTRYSLNPVWQQLIDHASMRLICGALVDSSHYGDSALNSGKPVAKPHDPNSELVHCHRNKSHRRAAGLRHGGVHARQRALPVVIGSECTGIIRCSLGLPGNMT
jgi:hypothetical protein